MGSTLGGPTYGTPITQGVGGPLMGGGPTHLGGQHFKEEANNIKSPRERSHQGDHKIGRLHQTGETQTKQRNCDKNTSNT